ncbi:unnamed protein product [Malus baccata var. baccata]
MRRLLIGSGFVKIADLLGSVVTVFDKELVRLLILKDCRFFFKLSRWTGLDVMELGPDGLLGLYNHRIPLSLELHHSITDSSFSVLIFIFADFRLISVLALGVYHLSGAKWKESKDCTVQNLWWQTNS